MGQVSRPRRGSLQYWPRKRAKKIIPSVNWKAIGEKNSDKKLLGFIGYKVGMKSVYVKDDTADSMTKGKRVVVPGTIIECPPMKILSVRFYKNGTPTSDVVSDDLDKTLKRKIKVPKKVKGKVDSEKEVKDSSESFKSPSDFDDVSVIVYSLVKNTSVKKKPDISEIRLAGEKEDKLRWIKEHIGKEIRVSEVFAFNDLADVRAVTKGKGNQGPVKRFGITLRSHKAEKGQRKVGSIGPWHPARVTFRVPMAGQMGMFTRAVYNNKVMEVGSISEKNINPASGFKKYGNIKTDYVILRGSVQGPSKRVMVLTQPLRKTKKQEKKNLEVIELR
ncbi:50S ribosomal protein L3 [Candidatus Pacearchaeota archaeon]|nr:50S ribosomal protein L3 [Candidatus Pacearchaeota archaeon]|tara:strand:+ start:5756 stop:6751 length:996 start_codon:yes stop_codon:yes gene_type:complete